MNPGSDPRDQISLKLLELVDFNVPDELVKEELALDGINNGGIPERGVESGKRPDKADADFKADREAGRNRNK